jgi:hypothetical protein
MPALLGGLWLATMASVSAFAQDGAAARGNSARVRCHTLTMPEQDLSQALKACGEPSIFFRPELFQSTIADDVFAPERRGDEFRTRFGQGRFVQRFPLYLNSFYPSSDPQAGEGSSNKDRKAVAGSTVRGGLIEDNSDDLGQPTVKSGAVTWASAPAVLEPGGRVTSVRGDLALKDSKIALSVTLSPGQTGKDLLVFVKLTGDNQAELGIPRLRRTGDRSGEPMDMVARKLAEGEFMFVPVAEPQALQNIAAALLRGQWLDVPVRQKGTTSYTLTMELARPGRALITQALNDWGMGTEGR